MGRIRGRKIEHKGAFKRGMILDTWVCDNPECRYLHFQAVAIDERFKNMKFNLEEISKRSRSKKNLKDSSERNEDHRKRNCKIKPQKQIKRP